MKRAEADEDYARVRDYIENSIKNRTLKSNGGLPTERELADRFRVGRGIARRALAALETKGLIYRHVGRGAFVKPPMEDRGKSAAPNGISSPADYIEARQRFEPEMAWMIV